MKKQLWKLLLLAVIFGGIADTAYAQKKKKKAPKKRSSTKRTTKTKTKANIQPTTATIDTVAVVQAPVEVDTLPIKKVLKSLRPDEAVETSELRDRTPLPYEH